MAAVPEPSLNDWSDWDVDARTATVLPMNVSPTLVSPTPVSPTLVSPTPVSPTPVSSHDDSADIDFDLDLNDAEYFARLDRRHLSNGQHSNGQHSNVHHETSSSVNTVPGVKGDLSGRSRVKRSTPVPERALVGDAQGAIVPKRVRRGRRIAFRTSISLVLCVLLLVGFVFVRLSQLRRIDDIAAGELDRPGTPTITVGLPRPTVVIIETPPPSLVPTPSVPGNEEPTLPTVSTIPGEGSCEDDPACANAPIVVLPDSEKPKANTLLIDPLDIEPIGGLTAENTLIIGTDSRKDVTADQEETFGQVGGKRSDTIMVLRVDSEGKEAGILSFPRDLYVHIAGSGKNDRINSAYAHSTDRLVKTIQQNFGTPVSHVVVIDFNGFQSVVETLGGVEICFDLPIRDPKSGLDQTEGCHLLTPKEATGYVRARQAQVFVDGEWKPDNLGDLGRIKRQQLFIRRVLQRAIDKTERNPVKANALFGDMRKAIQIDDSYGTTDLLGLVKLFQGFEPDALQSFQIQTKNARIDGKAVLRVDRPASSEIVALFGRR